MLLYYEHNEFADDSGNPYSSALLSRIPPVSLELQRRAGCSAGKEWGSQHDVERVFALLLDTLFAQPSAYSLLYEAFQVNENFDVYDIPMDVIWLDIEHTDGKKYFTWDSHKFAHPKEMIEGVAAKVCSAGQSFQAGSTLYCFRGVKW